MTFKLYIRWGKYYVQQGDVQQRAFLACMFAKWLMQQVGKKVYGEHFGFKEVLYNF